MVALIVLSVAATLTLGLFPGISEAALRSLVSSYTFFSAP
jgi:hypothetical protein